MVEKDSQLQKLREGVEDVRVIVQNNIEKTVEREEKLADLDERAEALLRKSVRFHKSTKKVKEKVETKNACLSWKYWRVTAVIIGVIVLAIIIISLIVVFSTTNEENKDSD
ncbi:vesicle-associated membrane protein 3-like [Clarias gariepinus]|uniref:vesicle-associated membrane protein 3-like n=1 Tax=Clarias gariepinus TaxID=13013 RepID=UPI00234C5018|nr:vesicle-associated membrane protein 3-like [Clarias gariepinus]